jgi:thioredoxin 1
LHVMGQYHSFSGGTGMAGGTTAILDASNYDSVIQTQGKLVAVDFWAKWCGPCRAVAPILEKLADEYAEKLIVGKLNVDENSDIAVRCGIHSIPTIILYKEGQIAETLIGAMDLNGYKAAIDKHLA